MPLKNPLLFRLLFCILCFINTSYDDANFPNSRYFLEEGEDNPPGHKCGYYHSYYHGVILVFPEEMLPDEEGNYSLSAHFNPYVYMNFSSKALNACQRYPHKLYEGDIFNLQGFKYIVQRSKCSKRTYFDEHNVKTYPDFDFVGEWEIFELWHRLKPWASYEPPYPECWSCQMDTNIFNAFKIGTRVAKSQCENQCFAHFVPEETIDCLCIYKKDVKDSRNWGRVYKIKLISPVCMPIPPIPSPPPFCNAFDQEVDIQMVPMRKASVHEPQIKVIISDGTAYKEESVLSLENGIKKQEFTLNFQNKNHYLELERIDDLLCSRIYDDDTYSRQTKEHCFDLLATPQPTNLQIIGSPENGDEGLTFMIDGLNRNQPITLLNNEFNSEYNLEVITPKVSSSGFLQTEMKCIQNDFLIDATLNPNTQEPTCPTNSDGLFLSYSKDPVSGIICVNGWKPKPQISSFKYTDPNDNKIKSVSLEHLGYGFIPVSYDSQNNLWYTDYSRGLGHHTIISLTQDVLDSLHSVGRLSNIFNLNIGGRSDYYKYSQIVSYVEIDYSERDRYPSAIEYDAKEAMELGIRGDGSSKYLLVSTPYIDLQTGQPYAIPEHLDPNVTVPVPDIDLYDADPVTLGLCEPRIQFIANKEVIEDGKTQTIKDPLCNTMRIKIYGAAESSGPWNNSTCTALSGAPGVFFEGSINLANYTEPELTITGGTGGVYQGSSQTEPGIGTATEVELCSSANGCKTIISVQPANTQAVINGDEQVLITSDVTTIDYDYRGGYCIDQNYNAAYSTGFLDLDDTSINDGTSDIYGSIDYNSTDCYNAANGNANNLTNNQIPKNSCSYPRSDSWCKQYCDHNNLSGLNFYQCFGGDRISGACGHLFPKTGDGNGYCTQTGGNCFYLCMSARIPSMNTSVFTPYCQGTNSNFCQGNTTDNIKQIKDYAGEENPNIRMMSNYTDAENEIVYRCMNLCHFEPGWIIRSTNPCSFKTLYDALGKDEFCNQYFCKLPTIDSLRDSLCDICHDNYDPDKVYTNVSPTGNTIVGCPYEASTYPIDVISSKPAPGTGGCTGDSIYQDGGDARVEIMCTDYKLQI